MVACDDEGIIWFHKRDIFILRKTRNAKYVIIYYNTKYTLSFLSYLIYINTINAYTRIVCQIKSH